ncbi:MAG: hypothetical protein IKX74_00575 [Erysipelotrichaceae bacterium]|nr:hypothetical protein [Erysipelotrichaceae bacterium]MBR5048141.1 hypothetical protein [Erysipelotrichaceae bacterium]
MKKSKSVLIIIALLLILLCPYSIVRYRDGGTRDYKALLYRVVVWNRLMEEEPGIYHRISIYFYPDTRRSIDELWQLESSKE